MDDASEAQEPLPRRRPAAGPPDGPPQDPLPAEPLPPEPLPRRTPGPASGLPSRPPQTGPPGRSLFQPASPPVSPPNGPPASPPIGPPASPPIGQANGQGNGQGTGQLPRRPPRVRPAGRHRSPHRLTLPPDAPPLVLAVAGYACLASDDIVAGIASAVGASCPGAPIMAGYLEGSVRSLAEMLAAPGQDGAPLTQTSVIVPLLAGPHPRSDAALAAAAAAAASPILLTSALGPHPLVAEALHARLAEAGLARASRTRGLTITSPADGIIVLADRGHEAAETAGVAAVLLSSRLAVPAAPASLGDQASLEAAIARLHAAGAYRLAIAPCVIGPENDPGELDAACAATGAMRSQPLAAHPAISQLVAMRYGAALADRRLAG